MGHIHPCLCVCLCLFLLTSAECPSFNFRLIKKRLSLIYFSESFQALYCIMFVLWLMLVFFVRLYMKRQADFWFSSQSFVQYLCPGKPPTSLICIYKPVFFSMCVSSCLFCALSLKLLYLSLLLTHLDLCCLAL